MLIDRKSISWILVCSLLALIAGGFYWNYAHHAVGGPRGGSTWGICFGIAGSAAMLVSMALAARKRLLRPYPLGRTYYWMQAHVWFGMLSFPLILFHAGGFHLGGALTRWLMWLYFAVMISGWFGLILQNIIPTRLRRQVPAETIYDQIGAMMQRIREEAEAIVRKTLPHHVGSASRTDPHETVRNADPTDASDVATAVADSDEIEIFANFYEKTVAVFLGDRFVRRSPLAHHASAQAAFQEVRSRLPSAFSDALSELEILADERRQYARQIRLQRWLRGWLFLHIPVSYGMLALGIIHAVYAFHYTTPGR